MVSIEQIREVFSKGSIMLSKNVMVIAYPKEGEYVNEGIERGNNQSIFEAIIESCESFRIILDSDGIRLVLKFGGTIYETPAYFEAIQHELTSEEMEEIANSMSHGVQVKECGNKFVEFFDGANLEDEKDLVERFLLFSNWVDESEDDGVSSLAAYQRWQAIEKESKNFRKYAGECEIECLPPDRYSHGVGSIAYIYSGEGKRVIEFSGRSKSAFVKLIHCSDGVGLEFDHYKDEEILTIVVGTERDKY
jgi:hypothetical protein